MTATTASTSMERSSQTLSTERREGVSTAELVMDDMANGNPACLSAQLRRCWASFPGIHIAQVTFASNWQLWRNFPRCGATARQVKPPVMTGGVAASD